MVVDPAEDVVFDEDKLADLPECKTAATVDPAGLVRFDVPEDYADALLEQVGSKLDRYDGDGLIDIRFIMDHAAFLSLTNGLRQLQEADGIAVKQVLPWREDPAISVTVAINESQIQSTHTKCLHTAQRTAPPQLHGHEFGVGEAGARLLVTQLAAALQGHQNPMEVAEDMEGDDAR